MHRLLFGVEYQTWCISHAFGNSNLAPFQDASVANVVLGNGQEERFFNKVEDDVTRIVQQEKRRELFTSQGQEVITSTDHEPVSRQAETHSYRLSILFIFCLRYLQHRNILWHVKLCLICICMYLLYLARKTIDQQYKMSLTFKCDFYFHLRVAGGFLCIISWADFNDTFTMCLTPLFWFVVLYLVSGKLSKKMQWLILGLDLVKDAFD